MINIPKLESVIEEDGILFLAYGGSFTQSLIVGMTGILEKEVESSLLTTQHSNDIFVIFIELAQNIMNYSKAISNSTEEKFDPKGLIFVGKREGHYFVGSQNIISKKDKHKLQEQLSLIQTLSKEAIKQRYKEVRRSGKERHDKGSGLGFLEIAKKVQSIEFEFQPINEEKFYFKLFTTI